jgi:hypothetical protein
MEKNLKVVGNRADRFQDLEAGMIQMESRLHFVTDSALRMGESFRQVELSQEALQGLGMVLNDLCKDFAELRRLYYLEADKQKAARAA